MRILFDFEFIGDTELDSRLAEILLDAKEQLMILFKGFEKEMEDTSFIIFSWRKDFATIIISAPEDLAKRMYDKYDDYIFYTNLIKKYKTTNSN
jgi:hypothetical protein